MLLGARHGSDDDHLDAAILLATRSRFITDNREAFSLTTAGQTFAGNPGRMTRNP